MKSWLKAQHSQNEDPGIWSHHSMAKNGVKVETVTEFIFLGCRITTDGDCGHKINRHLLLGKKTMANLDSILKSRHHFVNKGLLVKATVFPVVMYGCEEQKEIDYTKYYLGLQKIQPVNPKGNQP